MEDTEREEMQVGRGVRISMPLMCLLAVFTFTGFCWFVAWGIKLLAAIGRLVLG